MPNTKKSPAKTAATKTNKLGDMINTFVKSARKVLTKDSRVSMSGTGFQIFLWKGSKPEEFKLVPETDVKYLNTYIKNIRRAADATFGEVARETGFKKKDLQDRFTANLEKIQNQPNKGQTKKTQKKPTKKTQAQGRTKKTPVRPKI